MNATEALKIARDALQRIALNISGDTCAQVVAGEALAATASIERPEVGSIIASEEFTPLLVDYLLAPHGCAQSEYAEMISHIDAHCAQQVVAALAEHVESSSAAIAALMAQQTELMRERDELQTQVAAAKTHYEANVKELGAAFQQSLQGRDELRAQLAGLQQLAKREKAEHAEAHKEQIDNYRKLSIEFGELRAQLAARIEPGEPVAETYSRTINPGRGRPDDPPPYQVVEIRRIKDIPTDIKLYTAPQPNAQPAMWFDPLAGSAHRVEQEMYEDVRMVTLTGATHKWGEFTAPLYTAPQPSAQSAPDATVTDYATIPDERANRDIANRLAMWLSSSMDQHSKCDEMRTHIAAWLKFQPIAQPAPVGDERAARPAPVSESYSLDSIAQACVVAGLGVLQCQTLLSAIKGDMSGAQKALIAKVRAARYPEIPEGWRIVPSRVVEIAGLSLFWSESTAEKRGLHKNSFERGRIRKYQRELKKLLAAAPKPPEPA